LQQYLERIRVQVQIELIFQPFVLPSYDSWEVHSSLGKLRILGGDQVTVRTQPYDTNAETQCLLDAQLHSIGNQLPPIALVFHIPFSPLLYGAFLDIFAVHLMVM